MFDHLSNSGHLESQNQILSPIIQNSTISSSIGGQFPGGRNKKVAFQMENGEGNHN